MLISICIPSYKKPESLKRLLESISIQLFKDFEIILSDDSNDNSVKEVVNLFPQLKDCIKYQQNLPAFGMPDNWNHAINMAKGEWIKMMHDDDFFADEFALESFANAVHSGGKFVFSAFINVDNKTGKEDIVLANKRQVTNIQKEPLGLYALNIIGPPSTTMIHRSVLEDYDARFRWRVDVEMYIRLLKKNIDISYIEKPLIKIGLSDTQITQTSKNNPIYEIPELYMLLEMYGSRLLKEVKNYDTAWRTIRNTGVRNVQDLEKFYPGRNWSKSIKAIVNFQNRLPISLLKNGVVSKFLMLTSYLFNK